MADLAERLPQNAAGDLYVDRSCIDCDTCRRVAPGVFTEGDGFSYVGAQPQTEADRLRALMALVACPTASIGTVERTDATPGARAFPERIAENVSFCGFTAESSFGAWSWLIERPEGNVLVDSPRAAGPLLKALEARGGIRTLFLTHRDDVADHKALNRRFGCERILHEDDLTSGTRDIERPLRGGNPVALAPDLLAIPTPGHTRGHAVLLYKEKFLFTGDHLAWSTRRGHLVGFRDACWYSWPEQIRSMERLLDYYSFEWVLPGHGERFHAESPAAMRRELERCIAWMKGPSLRDRGLDRRDFQAAIDGADGKERAFAELAESRADGGRAVGRREEDDAASAACPAGFAAPGSGGPGGGDGARDQRGLDDGSELPAGIPLPGEGAAHRREVHRLGGLGHPRGGAAHALEVRGDPVVALEARPEDLQLFMPEECEAPVSRSVRWRSQRSASTSARAARVRPGSNTIRCRPPESGGK